MRQTSKRGTQLAVCVQNTTETDISAPMGSSLETLAACWRSSEVGICHMDWCREAGGLSGGPLLTGEKKLSESWATFRRLSDRFRCPRVPGDIRNGFYVNFDVDVVLQNSSQGRFGKILELF